MATELKKPVNSRERVFGQPMGGNVTKPMSFKEAYPAAVEQTGEDYSGIMKGYQDILNGAPGQNQGLAAKYEEILNNPTGSQFKSVTPVQQNYNPDAGLSSVFSQYQNELGQTTNPALQTYSQNPDVAASIAKLKEYSDTGGLSPTEVQELRARGISPIRAIYANATRNAERGRALSGGYSPNAGASSARMARELSEQIAGQTSNVNAGIAEMQQKGRLQMAPQYSDAASRESGVEHNINSANMAAKNRAMELDSQRRLTAIGGMGDIAGKEFGAKTSIEGANAAAVNQANQFNSSGVADANKFNAGQKLAAIGGLSSLADKTSATQFGALSGMTSLYGTTPALASTFGNQAAQAAQLQQGANQATKQTGLSLIGNQMQKPIAKPISPYPMMPVTKPMPMGSGLYKNVFAGK